MRPRDGFSKGQGGGGRDKKAPVAAGALSENRSLAPELAPELVQAPVTAWLCLRVMKVLAVSTATAASRQ